MLFDADRESPYRHDVDAIDALKTDLGMYDLFDPSAWQDPQITLLTPRDRHPAKIQNPAHTVCILDEDFFDRHPRSSKRLGFIQAYADLYGIKIYK
jgi:hypothetical protein